MDLESKLILSFNPCFRHFIQYLLDKSSDLSFMNDPLKIVDACSGSQSLNMTENADRLKLRIPYAQQVLIWEVIFDVNNWKEPPDFIFDDADDFYPPLDKINSFILWDWKNQESLAAVVAELLELYKEHHLERAGTNINLQRHFRSLLAESPRDLQVIVNKNEKGLSTVNVLVKLEVTFESLPPYLQQGKPGPHSAVLHAYLSNPDASYIKTQLFLSPAVENAFGGPTSLHIPAFQQGVLLGEYLVLIKQLLVNQILLVTKYYEKRKDFILAFVNHFGKSVLEYDVEAFNKIVLLFEWNDFFFTFTVELPFHFPDDRPTFFFKSIYHNQNKKPYTEKHTHFPYSPRWSGNEMAKRTSDFILSHIKAFQMASVNNSDR
ncbi:BRCA1-A complex subunit BRE [Biomphalaria pfeifferi]|uniref:BRISC and BRCA1-A complex member 2 n=1 Tax=Biomphalaria pfeifferi TaxID=112525 RepID=A0AAD8BD92_BIOPF|nr:BRCA1-A complex subunit BRE [Biomphalaria pfeifferi]